VVVARELPRAEWMMALTDGGLSTDYARLVTTMFDLHNAGRIDTEAGTGEVRCGQTELDEVLATLVNRP
jgi:NAD(P)H dehydrogenase (quinone)